MKIGGCGLKCCRYACVRLKGRESTRIGARACEAAAQAAPVCVAWGAYPFDVRELAAMWASVEFPLPIPLLYKNLPQCLCLSRRCTRTCRNVG